MTLSPLPVMAAFFLNGTVIAGLNVRLPDLQLSLGLGEGVYGLVLLGLPIGVVTGSLMLAPRLDGFGPRRTLAVALPVSAAIQVGAALAVGAWSLGLVLVAFGLSFAVCNVAINVEADRFEAATGRRIMSRCHGWWAVGFLAASLAAAGVVRAGIAPLWQFMAHTLLVLALAGSIVLPMASAPPRGGPGRAARFALPGRATLLIGGFAFAGILLEGTTRSWAVIYVRDVFGAPEWIAALSLSALVLTQTLGRFLGDGWIERFGAAPVLRAVALTLAAGCAIFAAAPGVAAAFLGCLLIGLGISLIQPQAFAAAARQTDRPAAESVAAFATLGTVIGFFGPPVFGGLAEWIGLRAAFALMVPLPLLSLLFVRRVAS